MKKKIYIAGKVTGTPIADCTLKFGSAQKEIEALGFEAVNPLEVVNDWHCTWEAAMKKCIKALMDCDGIFLLPCVSDSPGARVECYLVDIVRIPVFTIKDLIKISNQITV